MADAEREIPRRKLVPIKVYCLERERTTIEGNAVQAGLSASQYLRTVGAGYVVKSSLDHKAVRDMALVNADLGRLGGLLKALLTNEERFDGYSGLQLQQVTQSVVIEILETQRELRKIVGLITGK